MLFLSTLCLTKVYLSAGLGLGVAPSLGLLTSSESSAAPSAHLNVLMLGSLFCFPPQICPWADRAGALSNVPLYPHTWSRAQVRHTSVSAD